jgi:hypothetical protein
MGIHLTEVSLRNLRNCDGRYLLVILLPSRIPEGQLDALAIDIDIGDVVFEDGWDVNLSDDKECRGDKR